MSVWILKQFALTRICAHRNGTKYAAHVPNVNRHGVVCGAKKNLGRPVPQRQNLHKQFRLHYLIRRKMHGWWWRPVAVGSRPRACTSLQGRWWHGWVRGQRSWAPWSCGPWAGCAVSDHGGAPRGREQNPRPCTAGVAAWTENVMTLQKYSRSRNSYQVCLFNTNLIVYCSKKCYGFLKNSIQRSGQKILVGIVTYNQL